MIRVVLPYHLRNLARVSGEIELAIPGQPTLGSVLNEIETRFPMLRGLIREHGTLRRRPFVRYYACQEDLSHEAPDLPLPAAVANGKEPLLIVGAMSGG
jgi:hypothetical protein